ncbi:hypothetical protein [Flavobacterium sp.]|uniref:hypothetical protein n=1 Tax=Flavobacterium sp. TaxID=239 RepID=UPI00286D0802|nr:hypothetical protein [Flavobacterium sp.]
MKKTLSILLVFISSLVFFGCSSSEPIACYLPAPIVSSNSPVLSGQSINLITPIYSESANAIYEWTGPNGFVSNVQNPTLTTATSAMAGEYSLKTTIGICETPVTKTTVEVIINTVTCTPTNNTATFTGASDPSANFYFFDSYAFTENRYRFLAGDGSWNISVDFLGDTTPTSGIYSIVNAATTLTASTVRVTARYTFLNDTFKDYFAKSGDVSIAYVGGKAVIKFCAIPFALPTSTGTDFTSTTQFTQD